MFQKIIFKHTMVQHLSWPPVVIFSLLFLVKNIFFFLVYLKLRLQYLKHVNEGKRAEGQFHQYPTKLGAYLLLHPTVT